MLTSLLMKIQSSQLLGVTQPKSLQAVCPELPSLPSGIVRLFLMTARFLCFSCFALGLEASLHLSVVEKKGLAFRMF